MKLLIWILNAPPTTRRAMAWGIAASVVAMTVATGVVLMTTLSKARQEVIEKREVLGQLQAVVELAKSMDKGRTSDAIDVADEFLTGDSEALIQSALQARLGEIASANSVTVVSVGVAADGLDGDASYIGLRANLTGSVEGIHGTILALETNRPFLFIREAKLRSTNVTAGAGLAAPVELFAELVFYGARKTAGEAPKS